MVKYMKKLLLTFTICFFVMFSFKEEKTMTTFNEDTAYSFYTLEFPLKNISTNNFNDYFKNIDVISIEPYINKLYQNQIKQQYQFTNIDKFKEDYLKVLENNGYRSEAVKLKIEGIKIKKIKVYSSNRDLARLNIEKMIIEE